MHRKMKMIYFRSINKGEGHQRVYLCELPKCLRTLYGIVVDALLKRFGKP